MFLLLVPLCHLFATRELYSWTVSCLMLIAAVVKSCAFSGLLSFVSRTRSCAHVNANVQVIWCYLFLEVLQLHLEKAILQFALKFSCQERGSRSCRLLNSFNGTSLAVSHWELRMDKRLFQSFTAVIQPLSTRLTKPNLRLCALGRSFVWPF